MPWKPAFTSASACLGALRSRLRSLWTAHRCTGVLFHTVESARQSPALRSRAGDAPRVGAREVRCQHRLVDLAHAPLVTRHQLRGPLLRAAWREEPALAAASAPAARSAQSVSGSSCRCAPRSAPRCARTARRPAPRHFLLHRLLDGGADVLVDQDSEGDLLFMHQLQLLESLVHGAFLRSSPWPATGWWFPNRKNAPFHFPHRPGRDQQRRVSLANAP